MTMPELSGDDLLRLRAFRRQFDRIRNSSIGQQRKLQVSKTTKIDLRTGEATVTMSGFDPEKFQSVLPILRQFVLKKEPINFFRVCKIIREHCPRPELVALVDEAERRWNEILADVPQGLDQHLHLAASSLEEALQKLFYGYGGLFHVDIYADEEQAAVATVEQVMLHSAFPKLGWCLNVVDNVIRWWLEAPHESVPPVPSVSATTQP